MKNELRVLVLIVLTFALGLGGCKGLSAPAVTTSPLPQPASGTSPLSTSVVTLEAQPVPSSPPVIFPTSQPGLTTVKGVLPKAYLERIAPNYATIYLGEWIETTDPIYPMVALEKTTAPQALLDINTGEFLFYDVPPGKYGVLVERPLMVPVLLNNPETGQTLYLQIESNEHVDLGIVVINE